MRTLTVRLPDAIVAEIEHQSRTRRISKSDIVRERLTQLKSSSVVRGSMSDICGDLLGSVHGLPADLSSRKKKYLPDLIRGKKHHS